jgi:hypothetical protein
MEDSRFGNVQTGVGLVVVVRAGGPAFRVLCEAGASAFP